jgi:hypothetical protein
MNIKHHPLLDIKKIEKHYSEKDGVPVKYVCTSAPNLNATYAADIFYRETPHPEHGNHYFGIYVNPTNTDITITNVDNIEDLEFNMIQGPRGWEYSQHRHDYRSVGITAVDGGRAYFKRSGDLEVPTCTFIIRNGKFEEV